MRHPDPPPQCSVLQGTHNAVTGERLPVTVCSQCRAESGDHINLTNNSPGSIFTSHGAEIGKQYKLVLTRCPHCDHSVLIERPVVIHQ